jgi:hypothetical protein
MLAVGRYLAKAQSSLPTSLVVLYWVNGFNADYTQLIAKTLLTRTIDRYGQVASKEILKSFTTTLRWRKE